MKQPREGRYNVVLFWYMNDWGKYGRAYEKIAENLSKQPEIRRVLCVLPPHRTRRRYSLFPFLIQGISGKLAVLTPISRPIFSKNPSNQALQKIQGSYFPISFKKYLKWNSFRFDNTILWVFPPHEYIWDLIRWVPHKGLVTQIVDNNMYKKNDPAEKIDLAKSQYEKLAPDSDVVITSSRLNHEFFSSLNPNCRLFENAVDPVFFREPTGFPYLSNRTRPRLGYTGWISERTDLDLLRHVARNRPDCDLILAGPVEVSREEFGRILLPNVRYEGVVPYVRMPSFLGSLDVCLIPHLDTPFSRSMSPLKLFQYLASGRPIVSTNVAGVDRWDRFVAIGDTHEDFLARLDEVLRSDTIERSRERVEAARLESWEHRVRSMVDTVLASIEPPRPHGKFALTR